MFPGSAFEFIGDMQQMKVQSVRLCREVDAENIADALGAYKRGHRVQGNCRSRGLSSSPYPATLWQWHRASSDQSSVQSRLAGPVW